MANISGVNGRIFIGATVVGNCKKITTNFKSNNPQFATQTSNGFMVSVGGVKSGSVSFDLVLDIAFPAYAIIDVGAAVTLLVYENALRYWTIPVRIEEYDENIDIDNGGEVTLGYKASTNGQWTQPS